MQESSAPRVPAHELIRLDAAARGARPPSTSRPPEASPDVPTSRRTCVASRPRHRRRRPKTSKPTTWASRLGPCLRLHAGHQPDRAPGHSTTIKTEERPCT